ncbi:MAG: hypothetical protein US20_C0005G0013 [Candidatus Pacebacteria bacterium GW2011_GWF1_36_5]|nr:MAG: hypothetical protein US20_C0005G0013 [Candidatus Pacebacteria bacterium GW2011_GWF1_36_5]
MKFTSDHKSLQVYQAKNRRFLNFVDGAYETNDLEEIELLKTVKEVFWQEEPEIIQEELTAESIIDLPEEVKEEPEKPKKGKKKA